jgi:hypothetical protein
MVLAGVALSAGIAWQGCSSRLTPPKLPPPEYEPAPVLASASASKGQTPTGEAEPTAGGLKSTVGELDGGVGDAEWEVR